MRSTESFEGQVDARKDLTANDDLLDKDRWVGSCKHQGTLEFLLNLLGYDPLRCRRVDHDSHQETERVTWKQDETNEMDASSRAANRCANLFYKIVSLLCLYSLIKFWTLGINRFVIATVTPANATRLNLISETLGDPLLQYPDISVLVYMGVPTFSVLFVVGFQLYARMNPINDISLRFMLKPLQEMRRIDSSIIRMLDEISDSLIHYRIRSPVIGLLGLRDYRLQVMERIAFIERQHSLIMIMKKHHRLARPQIYSSSWLRSSQPYLFGSLVCSTAPSMGSAFVLMAMLVNRSRRDKCKLREAHINDCGYTDAFGPSELLVLLELMTNITLANVGSGYTFAIFGLSSRCYLELVDGNKRSLLACLKLLRCANNQLIKFENDEQRARVVDFSLLKALVKFRIFEKDARAVSKTVSQTMCMIITSCIGALAITGLTRPLGNSFWFDFSLAYFLLAWLVLDGLVSFCAYQRSQMLKSKKIAYSIMAEICRRSQTYSKGATTVADNPIITAWRKTVRSDCFKDQLTISPFNVGLTYERALQVNFFIVSMVALIVVR